MALVGERLVRRQHRCGRALSVFATGDAHRRARTRASPTSPAGRSTTTGPRTSSPAATARACTSTVGSNSNVAENGMDKEDARAAILEVDSDDRKAPRLRLRPAQSQRTGWQPTTGGLWTVVNERDEIGSDLVPDYLTSVRDGGFYGWPYSYFGTHVDERVKPPRPDLVAKAIVARLRARHPCRAAGAGVLPRATRCRRGMPAAPSSAMHGSWNRRPRSGYEVIFVPFAGGQPERMPEDGPDRFPGRRRRRLRPPGRRRDRQAPARCWWPTTSAT